MSIGAKPRRADTRECWTLCLEARETLVLSLTATRPVDAVLADWPSYSDWEHARFEGMPSGNHFANDSRSISWAEAVIHPPYVLVLAIANPGDEECQVRIQASIRVTRAAENMNDGCDEHAIRVRSAR